ncbi:hypothetical protein HB770_20745 [Rhizobium leguminosarum bv. viciae]|uniref:Uncharacterized protein n=1 Tax=Rhizobium leguminosarum bv. viciae TaxID=387 RepID=A0A7G6RL09_RHILV|nr:hypothetical protein HB770_20745 [Rhizobium leguminosarum bv. viciae]
MIERVARAIFDVCGIDGVTLPWEKTDQGTRDLHMEWAKAAIEAMRTPTEAMISEMESAASFGIGKPNDDEAIPRVWQWGIDAALKEQGKAG